MKLQIGDQIIDVERQLAELDRVDQEESLYKFLKAGWKYIDPAPWQDGWPIQAVAEHLEAVASGDIRNLIINIPPRCSKSSLVSVAFPAWNWAQPEKYWTPTCGPGVQFLAASYAQKLSIEHSIKCRRLIKSPWYQQHWGKRFALTSDQDAKMRFENDKGGYRFITSVDSGVTGSGGQVIILDDPNDASDESSEAAIESAIAFWDGTISTRLNDPNTGSFIVVQQRIAEDDITGHILSSEQGDWTHLMLPMFYEPERSFSTLIGWKDPRQEQGELLWPQRFSEPTARALEKRLGPFRSSGQLQQSPEPQGGGIIKREWWQSWDADAFPPMDYILASVDTAYTEKTMNDPSAMTVWGVFTQDPVAIASRMINAEGRPEYLPRTYTEQAPKVILMGGWAEHLEFHDLVLKVAATAKRLKCDKVLVENKASGISVAQELRRVYNSENFAVQLNDPKSQDKISRLYSVQHIFNDRTVYAPDRKWADEVITQVAQFPKAAHDDLCFIENTMIETSLGLRPIQDVSVGDLVLTPIGLRPVTASGLTGVRPVVTAGGLTGTGNHPLFDLDHGWVTIDTVTQANRLARLTLCDLIRVILRSRSSSTAFSIGAWEVPEIITCRKPEEWPTEKIPRVFTSPSGNFTQVRLFLRATKSTIEIATLLTSTMKIWSAYRWRSIARTLSAWIWLNRGLTWREFASSLWRGINLKRAARGIEKTLSIVWQRLGLPRSIASPALAGCASGVAAVSHFSTRGSSFARPPVRPLSQNIGSEKPKLSLRTMQPVYNLTVEGAHCYYANGVLVHNCDTVSQALRHLRDLGLLIRAPERLAEIDEMRQYAGKPPGALYPS